MCLCVYVLGRLGLKARQQKKRKGLQARADDFFSSGHWIQFFTYQACTPIPKTR